MEGISRNGDTSCIGIGGNGDKTRLIDTAPGRGARNPGFHTFLITALHTIAILSAISPSTALRVSTLAWIQSGYALPSYYHGVYFRRDPIRQINAHVDDRNLAQSSEGVHVPGWQSHDSKAYIREFLELKAGRHGAVKEHSHTDEATLYLEKRLTNIVNDVDNGGIVAEFGLNRYKSFTYFLEDQELVEQVVALMRRYHDNNDDMLLFGEPIAIKDNIALEGIPYTNGSALFKEYKSSYNAHVVEQLRKHGAIVIAKTAMNEFGVGSETKETLNPFGNQYLPGGSSGGSATAVGGGIIKMALGTDTGGSVRLPAAYCGCVGYRPSYGLLSRYGISELAAKLDVVGTCTQTVIDAIRLVYAMLKPCWKDATSSNDNAFIAKELLALLQPAYVTRMNEGAAKAGYVSDKVAAEMESPLKDVKIASLDIDILRQEDLIDEVVADNMRDVEKTLRELGAQIIRVKPPSLMKLCKVYHVYVASQIAANLQRFADQQYHPQQKHMLMEDMMKDMDSETVQRLKMGIGILQDGHDPEEVLKNAKTNIATWLSDNRIFTDIPLLIMPPSRGLAPKRTLTSHSIYDIVRGDIYTTFAPLIGACSISVPSGISVTGLPFSVQFTAAPFNDAEMLKVARIYKSHVDIHAKLQEMVTTNRSSSWLNTH